MSDRHPGESPAPEQFSGRSAVPAAGDHLPAGAACVQCGFRIEGLEPGGRCPECGAHIRSFRDTFGTLNVLPAVDPRSGFVVERTPCLNCGYNLQGLHPSGNCPECGAHVARSLWGSWLWLAKVEYLHTIALGASMVWWGFVAWAVAAGAFIATAVLGRGPLQHLHWVALVAFFAGGLAVLLGHWMLTAREPSTRVHDGSAGSDAPPAPGQASTPRHRALSARRIARASIIILAIGSLFSCVLAPRLSRLVPIAAMPSYDPSLVVLVVGILAAAALFFATHVHLLALARRAPQVGFGSFATVTVVLIPVITILGAPVFCFGPFAGVLLYAFLMLNVSSGLSRVLAHAKTLDRELPPPPDPTAPPPGSTRV